MRLNSIATGKITQAITSLLWLIELAEKCYDCQINEAFNLEKKSKVRIKNKLKAYRKFDKKTMLIIFRKKNVDSFGMRVLQLYSYQHIVLPAKIHKLANVKDSENLFLSNS